MGPPEMIRHLKPVKPSSFWNLVLVWRLAPIFLLPLAGTVAAAEIPPALRVYQVGDIAPADIITPYLLAVPDPIDTARLRAIEAARSPAVFRHNSAESEIAVQELTNNWFSTRQRFIEIISKSFPKFPLSTADVASPTFRRIGETFRVEFPADVFSRPLAQTWAVGGKDHEAIEGFSTLLREVMRRRILSASPTPPHLQVDAKVRVLSMPLSSGTNRLTGINLYPTNFASLEQTRSTVRDQLGGDAWGGEEFLPAFIRPNCWFDPALTSQVQTQIVASVMANKWFGPGETVVAKGAVIDDRAKAALDQLRLRVARASSPANHLRPVAPPLPWWNGALQNPLLWMIAAGLVLLAVTLLLWGAFRSPRVELLPGPVSDSELLQLASSRASGRDSLLARILTSEIVQRLFGQRQAMIETQLSVTSGAMALENRLGRVERQMHSRFHAYERRIVELEKELAESEELSRELIRAKIRSAKMDLQAAQAQAGQSGEEPHSRVNLN